MKHFVGAFCVSAFIWFPIFVKSEETTERATAILIASILCSLLTAGIVWAFWP